MIHYFTVGNDVSKAVHLMNSAAQFGVNMHFLHTTIWSGYYDKIRLMKSAIKDLPCDAIICFVDAYDVIVSGDTEEIESKFREFRCDLVFSAELNCWPEQYKSKYATGAKRFLNSGGYIGRQHAIMDLFNWRSDEEIQAKCKEASDQGYCAEYYLAHKDAGNIMLDTHSRIFQSMYFCAWRDFSFMYGQIYNTVLNQTPCFLHFNGNSYMTKDGQNVMPIFMEKMASSEEAESPILLHGVEAHITSWNTPRSQSLA